MADIRFTRLTGDAVSPEPADGIRLSRLTGDAVSFEPSAGIRLSRLTGDAVLWPGQLGIRWSHFTGDAVAVEPAAPDPPPATLTFRSESTGARPHYESADGRAWRALQTPEEEPQRRHRATGQRALRRITLRWDGTEYEDQVSHVLNLWTLSKGGVRQMEYTPVRDVDANKINVVFVDGSLRIEHASPVTYNMTVELEEQA